MALRWEIRHDLELVDSVAEGPVTREELEAHLDDVVIQNALRYKKLFDGTMLVPAYDDNDVLMMGARLSAYTANFDNGPLALVGTRPEVVEAFRRFVNISPSDRPAAVFADRASALAWLEEKARLAAQFARLSEDVRKG